MIGFALALEACGYNQTKKHHPMHRRYLHMLERCYDKRSLSYKDYGARGITVCDRWRQSFWYYAFDLGLPPGPGYEVDRIDNDGPYTNENCRWLHKKYQAQNRRSNVWVYVAGEKVSLTELAARIGVKYHTLKVRAKKGYPLKALLAPVVKGGV